jgi:hypothetical protein
MISENITKQQFIVSILKRDVEHIYSAQRLIATKNIYIKGKQLKATKRKGEKIGERTGSLLESLQNPDYSVYAEGNKFIISAGIVKHMRFLDMKHLGNRMIYNRQVWGILYNNSLREIKSGYGQHLHDLVEEALQKAFSPNNPE